MKPFRFDYERPRSMEAALALIARDDASARIIAGGQSLGPMLNMRLVRPELLVDITAIKEMTRVESSSDSLLLGACITHSDIEDGRAPDVARGAMRAVASGIAYRAVRNRGTIGGSLTNADPSADWVSALAALGADAVIRGQQGTRTLSAERYVTGALENALRPGELLEGLRIPVLSPAARWGYYKACRKIGEYPYAIGMVVIDPDRGMCRAVIGAVDAKPIVLPDARALFCGSSNPDVVAVLDSSYVDRLLLEAGILDSIDRQIRTVTLRRAAEQAFSR